MARGHWGLVFLVFWGTVGCSQFWECGRNPNAPVLSYLSDWTNERTWTATCGSIEYFDQASSLICVGSLTLEFRAWYIAPTDLNVSASPIR